MVKVLFPHFYSAFGAMRYARCRIRHDECWRRSTKPAVSSAGVCPTAAIRNCRRISGAVRTGGCTGGCDSACVNVEWWSLARRWSLVASSSKQQLSSATKPLQLPCITDVISHRPLILQPSDRKSKQLMHRKYAKNIWLILIAISLNLSAETMF